MLPKHIGMRKWRIGFLLCNYDAGAGEISGTCSFLRKISLNSSIDLCAPTSSSMSFSLNSMFGCISAISALSLRMLTTFTPHFPRRSRSISSLPTRFLSDPMQNGNTSNCAFFVLSTRLSLDSTFRKLFAFSSCSFVPVDSTVFQAFPRVLFLVFVFLEALSKSFSTLLTFPLLVLSDFNCSLSSSKDLLR